MNCGVFAVADGMGGLTFLRELTYQYLRLAHPELADQTGDSLAIFVWMMALAASIGGAITSVVMMKHNKKDSNK